MQTVEPLAAGLGAKVETEELLGEGFPSPAVELVRSLAGQPIVVCTHGDVIPAVLDYIRHKDAVKVPKRAMWEKGSTWVLEATAEGDFRSALYVPPPKAKPLAKRSQSSK